MDFERIKRFLNKITLFVHENLIQKVLIQINQGDEASKSGFSLNVRDYFEDLLSLSNPVNHIFVILGLMSIPPYLKLQNSN